MYYAIIYYTLMKRKIYLYHLSDNLSCGPQCGVTLNTIQSYPICEKVGNQIC